MTVTATDCRCCREPADHPAAAEGNLGHLRPGNTSQPLQKNIQIQTDWFSAALQVIAVCLSILQGRHDRSRLPAAQLLLALSARPALVPRLEPVLPTLLQVLADAGEKWLAECTAVLSAAQQTAMVTHYGMAWYRPPAAQERPPGMRAPESEHVHS